MILNKIIGLFSKDIAMDLGTANIIVSVKDSGIVINEPTVLAIQEDRYGKSRVLAVGQEAKQMLGKTPAHIRAIRPVQDGVIADFEATEMMIKYFINKVHNRKSFLKPRVVICVPYGVTQVERNAVKDSAFNAGAREVILVEEPMAAAIGTGIPVGNPEGHIVVDIGAGTTEVAVTSLGGLVLCKATTSAGDKFDQAIINYVKQNYNLYIGEKTAEHIKIEIGAAVKLENELKIQVKGRDNSGLLSTIELGSEGVRSAIKEPLKDIINVIKNVLENMPPDLAADAVDNGVILTGGGSLIRGLDEYISSIIKLPVRVSKEPLLAVAYGTSEVINDNDLLKLIFNE
ncbi:rod shape-determining protein [Candidatus Marinarcus aquaticus]|uniref:Cell shape-determining protein MreB n=1 Tax=Candidatus Marinarcus aquaticus TaxID=2044504 RepID=A0A4Q0XM53_9BACT|nr:rod shape-determining protein [Candidatus Marinarcus aquaticus]RXJ54455.1 rod shape-determining protein [Candidatus Marinarcus aquaticus]